MQKCDFAVNIRGVINYRSSLLVLNTSNYTSSNKVPSFDRQPLKFSERTSIPFQREEQERNYIPSSIGLSISILQP